MKTSKQEILQEFFEMLSSMEQEQMMQTVEKYLSDTDIEYFVQHIEDFYDIHDDEELGTLAQIMITGYLIAQFEKEKTSFKH